LIPKSGNLKEKKYMKDKTFVDTNVFIYVYSKTEPEKKNIALEILKNQNIIINTQVINEFIWVMNRKFSVQMERLRDLGVKLLQRFEIALIDQITIKKALDIAIVYKYSYWDSLIIASALENNCSICYSEDMQHGQLIEDRLKVINPFKESER
jgi:predicted nucleic acid-binding protein